MAKPCLRTQKRNHSTTPSATMNETTVPTSEHAPPLRIHHHVRRRSGGVCGLGVMDLLEEIPSRGGDHGGNGEQEAELQRGRAAESGDLPGGDGRHGARRAGKDSGERLAESDPHGLGQRHLFHVLDRGFAAARPDVDDPHDDAADQQRQGHGVQAAQVLLAPLVQQQRGHRGAGEGDQRQRDGMVEPVAVAVFALGKAAEEVHNPPQEQQHSARIAPSLDHDRVHLPVGVVQRNLHQRFGDAQMRRRADRQKLGQAFHDAQQDGLNIRIHIASRRCRRWPE